ncbi:unnamed protein product [Calypogeia fissa]
MKASVRAGAAPGALASQPRAGHGAFGHVQGDPDKFATAKPSRKPRCFFTGDEGGVEARRTGTGVEVQQAGKFKPRPSDGRDGQYPSSSGSSCRPIETEGHLSGLGPRSHSPRLSPNSYPKGQRYTIIDVWARVTRL